MRRYEEDGREGGGRAAWEEGCTQVAPAVTSAFGMAKIVVAMIAAASPVDAHVARAVAREFTNHIHHHMTFFFVCEVYVGVQGGENVLVCVFGGAAVFCARV